MTPFNLIRRILENPGRTALSLVLLTGIANNLYAQEFRQPSVISDHYAVDKHRQLVLSDPNITLHVYGTGNVHPWMMQQTEEMAKGIISSMRHDYQRAAFDNHHIFLITNDDPDVPGASIPGHKSTGNARYTVINQTLICAVAVATIRPNLAPVWRAWDTPIHELGHSIESALGLQSASDSVFRATEYAREYFPWRVESWFNANLRSPSVQVARGSMSPMESIYLASVFDIGDTWQPTCVGAPDPVERLSNNVPAGTTDSNRIDSTNWSLDASHNTADLAYAIDSIGETRWTTRQTQRMGQWFSIDMQQEHSVSRMKITTQDGTRSKDDHPVVYEVYASNDLYDMGAAVTIGEGDSSGTTDIDLNLNEPVRFLKIEQTGSSESNWWSIHQIDLYGDNADTNPSTEPMPENGQWKDFWGSAALPIDTSSGQFIASGQMLNITGEQVRFCFQNSAGPIEVFEVEVMSNNYPLALEVQGPATGWSGVEKFIDGFMAGQTGSTNRASFTQHNGSFQCIDFAISNGESTISEVLVNHDNAGTWRIEQVYVQYR